MYRRAKGHELSFPSRWFADGGATSGWRELRQGEGDGGHLDWEESRAEHVRNGCRACQAWVGLMR